MATRANQKRQRWTMLLAAVALAFAAGAVVFLRSLEQLPGPASSASVTPVEERGPIFVWFQRSSGKGAWDVTTELTIPGICTDRKTVTSISRYLLRDSDGNEHLIPSSRTAMYGCAVSLHGGPNLSGSLDLKESDEVSVLLSVGYLWSIPRDDVHGTLKKEVRVEIGVPAEFEFESGCHLKVSWQRNADVPDEPAATDF